MKNRLILSFLILSVIYLGGCQRISIDPKPPLGEYPIRGELKKMEKIFLLSGVESKSWIIYKSIYGNKDVTAIIPSCSLDNILTFYPSGEYIQTEGKEKCTATDAEIYDQGTWSFNNDLSHISIAANRFTHSVFINELNIGNLKVEFFDSTLNLNVQFWLKPIY
jgi:hypothetical protein